MLFIAKKSFCILVCGVISITASMALAQNQFSSTFNYESSKLPYSWTTSAWSACTGECNSGSQNRTVTCRDNAGNAAPSVADCAYAPMPELLRTCDLPDCQWVLETCPSHIHTQGNSGGTTETQCQEGGEGGASTPCSSLEMEWDPDDWDG